MCAKEVGNSISLYYKGLVLDKSGNYTGAILYYDKVLAMDSHYVNALTSKGLTLDKLGNYTGAIQYFDKALAMDPKDEVALYNKNNSFDHLGFLVSKP